MSDYTPETYTPTTDDMRARIATSSYLQNHSEKAEAEFDRWNAPREKALAAVQRVRELHNETNMGGCGDSEHCSPFDSEPICGSCLAEWPCPTIKALDGNHE